MLDAPLVVCDWTLRHRRDELLRSRPVADAPSGHAVGLREPVHRQGTRVQIGRDLRHRRKRLVAVDDVLVDVVGEHPNVRVAAQHLGEPFQILRRVERAGRVAGIVEDQPLRLRGECPLELLGRQPERVRPRGRDHHRRTAREQHHVGVAHPERRGDDDLVVGVERRGEGVVDDLLAAVAHQHLVGGIAQCVLAIELAADGLAQLGDAGERRVFRLPLDDGAHRRDLDVVRGVEVPALPRRGR